MQHTPAKGGTLEHVSEFLDVTSSDDEACAEAIQSAVASLRSEQLVVFPTDTVYGIAADAFSPEAVQALLAAKQRGRDMPPPVLLPSARTAPGVAMDIPDEAANLMTEFWPGPLTLVLHAQPSLQWDLGDTQGTVALRVPNHDVALDVLEKTGPLAVSSANVSGGKAARSAGQAAAAFGDAVEVYLDGGPCNDGPASTIVDCTRQPFRVLREGAIPTSTLQATVPSLMGLAAPAAAALAGSESEHDAAKDQEVSDPEASDNSEPVASKSSQVVELGDDPEPDPFARSQVPSGSEGEGAEPRSAKSSSVVELDDDLPAKPVQGAERVVPQETKPGQTE